MTLRTLTLDGGTEGAAIAAGDEGGMVASVSGVPVYSAAAAVHGARGAALTGFGAAVRVANTGSKTHSGSLYVKANGVTTGALRAVQFTTTGISLIGSVRLHSDGHFDLGSPTSARLVASSISWTPGTVCRIDYQFDYSGTNPALTARLFLDPEGAAPDETIGPVTLATTALADLVHVGALGGASTQTAEIDTYRWSSALEWLGPFAPPAASPWSLWNGAAEIPLDLDGVWNGAAVDPLSSVELAP